MNERQTVKHAAILAVVPLLLLVLYIANPVWRIFSDHGFLHQGIVYNILNNGAPPTSPIFAGQNLLYLWGHHYLVALIAWVTNAPLSWIFAGLNILALCFALAFAYRIGRRMDDRPVTGVFAALLALVSCNLFSRGIFVDGLHEILMKVGFAYPLWEYRLLIVAKFYNLNSNGLGIAAVLGWLIATCAFLAEHGRGRLRLVQIVLGAAAVGFLYPVYVINIAATMFFLTALALIRVVPLSARSVLIASVLSAVGLLLTVPYIRIVSAARTTPAITIIDDVNWLILKGMMLLCSFSIVLALIVLDRKNYTREVPRRWALYAPIALFAAVSGVFWLVLSQEGTEYKHLLIATVMGGLLAAPALGALAARTWVGATLLLAALSVSFASDWVDLMNTKKWPALTPVAEEGSTLTSPDPAEEALYAWVRSNTRPVDAFIDDNLLMPVAGQRSFYFGPGYQNEVLLRLQADTGREFADGWEWQPEDLLIQQGYNRKLIESRKQVALDLLRDGRSARPIIATFSGGDLYLVARAPRLRNILQSERGMVRVYSSPKAAIYRVTPPALH